jgi:hypothetical protein
MVPALAEFEKSATATIKDDNKNLIFMRVRPPVRILFNVTLLHAHNNCSAQVNHAGIPTPRQELQVLCPIDSQFVSGTPE